MIKNWVSVYTTGVRHLAEIATQMLKENGIPAVIFNNKDSSYLFGEIEVYVHKDNEAEAKKLIEEFENNLSDQE